MRRLLTYYVLIAVPVLLILGWDAGWKFSSANIIYAVISHLTLLLSIWFVFFVANDLTVERPGAINSLRLLSVIAALILVVVAVASSGAFNVISSDSLGDQSPWKVLLGLLGAGAFVSLLGLWVVGSLWFVCLLLGRPSPSPPINQDAPLQDEQQPQ